MPHDCKGRLIEKGDVLAASSWVHGGKKAALQVIGVSEGSDTCNVFAAHFDPRIPGSSFNAKETELILKHDGSFPDDQNPPAA